MTVTEADRERAWTLIHSNSNRQQLGDAVAQALAEAEARGREVEREAQREDRERLYAWAKEAQVKWRTQDKALRFAAGYISTTPGWTDKHPEEVLQWLMTEALKGGAQGECSCMAIGSWRRDANPDCPKHGAQCRGQGEGK